MFDRFLRRLQIRQRLWLLVALAMIGFLLVTLETVNFSSLQFIAMQKQNTLTQVEGARKIVEHFYLRSQSGELSRAEAKRQALNAVEALRPDERTYFYVYHSSNFIVMHPFLKAQTYSDEPPEIVEQSHQKFVDQLDEFAKSHNFPSRIVASVELFNDELPGLKSGFFEYLYYVDENSIGATAKIGDVNAPDSSERKMAYGTHFEPWDWVIFGGVFLDDLDQIFRGLVIELIVPVLLGAIIITLMALVISSSITQPLRDTMKTIESLASNGDFDQELDDKNRDEIGVLSRAFNALLIHIRDQSSLLRINNQDLEQQQQHLEAQVKLRTHNLTVATERAQAANKAKSDLLETSGEGFLSCGDDLVIHSEYSSACREMLGLNPDGRTVQAVLYPEKAEEAAVLSDMLRRVFAEEDDFKQQMKLSLLPSELVSKDKVLHVSFNLVEKNKMVLILRDLTNEYRLKEKVRIERQRLELIVSAVSESRYFYILVRDFKAFYQGELPKILDSDKSAHDVVQELFRRIHSFKGIFNQVFFSGLPVVLHQVESKLAILRDQAGDVDIQRVRQLFDEVDFESLLASDLEPVFESLGDDFLDKRGRQTISRSQIRTLELSLEKYAQSNSLDLADLNYKTVMQQVKCLRSANIKEVLVPFKRFVKRFAGTLEKKVSPMIIEGTNVFIESNVYNAVLASLGMVFRNAVDHGLESPEERRINGKPLAGTIACYVTSDDSNVCIRISDDGAGVNVKKLRQVLVTRNFLTGEKVSIMTDEQVLNFLFEDGVSSRVDVSDSSGRGVGLAAVRAEVEKLDGRIKISSEEDRGTTIEILLPITEHIIVERLIDNNSAVERIIV